MYFTVVLIVCMVDDVGFVVGKSEHGYVVIAFMYDTMYLVSTVITIYAIVQIYRLIVRLKITQSAIGVNKTMIGVHMLMLSLITIIAISQSLFALFLTNNKYLGTSIYIWCDLMLQCTICYICWTLGCSAEVARSRVVVLNEGGASRVVVQQLTEQMRR